MNDQERGNRAKEVGFFGCANCREERAMEANRTKEVVLFHDGEQRPTEAKPDGGQMEFVGRTKSSVAVESRYCRSKPVVTEKETDGGQMKFVRRTESSVAMKSRNRRRKPTILVVTEKEREIWEEYSNLEIFGEAAQGG